MTPGYDCISFLIVFRMQKYYFYEWLVVVVCKLFLLDVCCQSNLGEMRDYFKGDELELLCTHHRVGNQGRNTMWRFTRYLKIASFLYQHISRVKFK